MKIVRLKPFLSLGPNILARGIGRALTASRPDYCLLVGPGKLFGTHAFCTTRAARRVSIFQENSEDGRTGRKNALRSRFAALGHRLVKRRVYSSVVAASDRIVCNVPETKSILRPWLSAASAEAFAARHLDLRLGFDPESFGFDPVERARIRRQLGIQEEELLLCTCTRAVRAKRLEDLINLVRTLRRSGLPVRYALAGVMDDAYGQELRDFVENNDCSEFVSLLPVLRQKDMNGLYSAGDLGLWPQAAITIQQAMGTGLPIVLKNRKSVSHLVKDGVTGWYVEKGQPWRPQLELAIKTLLSHDAAERQAFRRQIVDINMRYLSYDQVALEMVRGL